MFLFIVTFVQLFWNSSFKGVVVSNSLWKVTQYLSWIAFLCSQKCCLFQEHKTSYFSANIYQHRSNMMHWNHNCFMLWCAICCKSGIYQQMNLILYILFCSITCISPTQHGHKWVILSTVLIEVMFILRVFSFKMWKARLQNALPERSLHRSLSHSSLQLRIFF